MRMRSLESCALLMLPIALAGLACGGEGRSSGTSPTAIAPTVTAPTAIAPIIRNVWSSAKIDKTRLPLGDKFVLRQAPPKAGFLWWCSDNMPPRPVGAMVAGPWLNETDGTWDLTKKVGVRGDVSWPAAEYGESVADGYRSLATNGLPSKTLTGTFPIAPSEEAYTYDRNPNSIQTVFLKYRLPAKPQLAAQSLCLRVGPIGLMRNGVALYAPIDEQFRDAAAWETQDKCQGHPQQQGQYHYHDVSECLQNATVGVSSVLGWAIDGFPIVLERNAQGDLPTNADLDDCHGRTAPYNLDGQVVDGYHYSVTLEFPYAIGCFKGQPQMPSP
jgi:YHYH protein